MAVEKYTAPRKGLPSFNCPYCGVLAHQRWSDVYHAGIPGIVNGFQNMTAYDASRCDACGLIAVWHKSTLVVPDDSAAPMSSPDMPPDVATDFSEARAVFSRSPRSSAALLCLAVQKLCVHLGEPGKNLNADIGALVKKGLPPQIQAALDVVRVVGNNQVHPGVLDVRDDPATASALFGLVNLIVDTLITRPKEVQALFDKLPDTAKEQISQRDVVATTPK